MKEFYGLIILNLILIIGGIITYYSKQNYIIGLRTTDTLSDERVWKKANQFAGKLLIITGIIYLIIIFILYLLGLKRFFIYLTYIYLGTLIGEAIISAIYAHVYAKKLKRGEEEKHLILKKSFNYLLISLSIILIIIGFILPFIKPNIIIGVRLPKTLENPQIWKSVNTISGIILIIFGLIFTYIFYKLLNKEDLERSKSTIKIIPIFLIVLISIILLTLLIVYLI